MLYIGMKYRVAISEFDGNRVIKGTLTDLQDNLLQIETEGGRTFIIPLNGRVAFIEPGE